MPNLPAKAWQGFHVPRLVKCTKTASSKQGKPGGHEWYKVNHQRGKWQVEWPPDKQLSVQRPGNDCSNNSE